ncbi:methyltransferase family protein [Rhizobium sp. YTU87027]|uniref:methyltransferase family protein n=1 Tax=Rhizobium sp. YTU87027 TaxID=3417741 RepID=UPI003D69D62C
MGAIAIDCNHAKIVSITNCGEPMSSRYLVVADIVGRISISLYFIPVMISRVIAIHDIFARGDLSSLDMVTVAADFSSMAFAGMMSVVAITRLPPIRSAENIEGYVTAMSGTFLLVLVVGYLPPAIETPMALRLIGLGLTIIGCLASAYVLVYLGRAFSIMPEARALITSGPYSVVRNPLYLTEEIAVIGFIILNLSVWTVLLGAAHWMLQLRRMVNEERVLQNAFPEYEGYAATVPRVVPFTSGGKLLSLR